MSSYSSQGRHMQQLADPSALAYMASDFPPPQPREQSPASSPRNGSFLTSPTSSSQPPERARMPHRASTVSTPYHSDQQRKSSRDDYPHARSEDLNHSSSSSRTLVADPASSDPYSARSQGYLTASRPTTPGTSNSHNQSSSDHSDNGKGRPGSVHSDSSLHSSGSNPGGSGGTVSVIILHRPELVHSCVRTQDCGTVVASKFFPIDGPDGKQHPLCERDYFRRLNLICAKCGMALRGSYITACNKKFHVEHFSCSVCPTLFGPQDSYYEHEGDVYCHYHYSTRFATKCAGCNSAILKQFVEINRNMRDECWHPECYMINKFWNVKVVARRPALPPSGDDSVPNSEEPPWVEEERTETAVSLKDKQIQMEQQVYRIWTVLSAFEESSAACISDMLRQVSNGQYLEAIRMAEKFILHVEVLFATIDDLEWHFARLKQKGMSHVREARMLCRKTVDLFTLLSHTQETGARRMGMTQELLALVTGLAHYLKILIRIALTGALKLEREQNVHEALTSFLDKLHMLAVQGGSPSAKRMMKRANGELMMPAEGDGNFGTQGVTFGFRSLAPENAGESPFASGPRDPGLSKVNVVNPPSDLCVKCSQTVEEDCVRLGTYQRWHSHCVQCSTCGKTAAVPAPKEPAPPKSQDDRDKDKDTPKLSTARRPPANVAFFIYEVDSVKETSSFGPVPIVLYCTEHGHSGCRSGFQAVSRLEQYAFLLNVALRRLYVLLKKRGVVQLAPAPSQIGNHREDDPYRDAGEINRLKSVHLDRKLSATARVPRRSTVVESPTGKVAQPADVVTTQRPHELVPSHSFRATPHGVTPSPSRQPQLQRSPQQLSQQQPPQQQPSQQPSRIPPGTIDTNPQGQVLRPPFARNNTGVMIVDDSAPTSPTGGVDDPVGGIEDGITLADIPQIVEAAQAREQRRSLPRQSSIPFIAELNTLELAVVKHCAVLVLQRSPLRDQFDLEEILELVEMKKSTFWNRLFKPGNDKKNVKKKGIFGVPLELLVEREGAESLLGASRAAVKIPSFVEDVISSMRQMDMSVEGIFRRNGNIRRLNQVIEAIDRDPSSVDFTQDNPVQLAALLKKFFRELPDPLMTFKLHKLFIASQSLPTEQERNRMLHLISLILPKAHRDTMEVLFVFLKWVAKMDLPNLATLRSDPSITALLENQDEFYFVPQEFLPILQDQDYFANSLDLPSKEFLKKCEPSAPFNPGTPRPEDMRSMPPRAQTNPQFQDRPPLVSSPSDNPIRNGQPQSRQPPSAPALQHSSFSYPLPSGAPPPSTSQAQPNDEDWSPPERQPFIGQVPSRPASMSNSYVPPRSSGEGAHPFIPNGHPQPAVRQRI
ncbi:uncharacterized protein B0H18DRAFT_1011057 [Fomitopsis serialis]|uniref:uncharacterized protein n=1 Tax=Fomitopsis serialis TaxID=139415 RepID=UPI002007A1AE|nr:uncharacterized protein B0H18DRAFT_1011057 [Neoantrodia serialis]KAH9924759.1 hypothetical protein B0H18DRAFT_1011057 [Neoantrodia serialis]